MEISVYGSAGCPQMASVTEYISAGGSMVKQVDIASNPISQTVLDRLIAFERKFSFAASQNPGADLSEDIGGLTQTQVAGTGSDTEKLRQLLRDKPSVLAVPLAVRGSRVVVASSPDRIQSLMY